MDQLQRLGCDVAQGYFVACPMSTASMAEWVRHHRLEAAGSPYCCQDRGTDTRYGMTIPFDGVPLPAQREWLVEVAELGYTTFWLTEAHGAAEFNPPAPREGVER